MPQTKVFAPAKVNLTLHVIGQRADGYHLLDSLVTFAPVGDWLHLAVSDQPSLAVDGPMSANVPADATNLVARAIRHHADICGFDGKLALRLTKNLPPASGIGGGSSDAAAAIRGAMALLNTPEIWCRDGKLAVDIGRGGTVVPAILDLAALGADVPMCHAPKPARIGGIGEALVATTLPRLPAVLVNPRVAVPTPLVFRGLVRKDNAPMPSTIPAFGTARACIAWLRAQRNDLQAPAINAAPLIADVLAVLAAQPGAGLARMSGSGATCFALFNTEAEAEGAQARIAAHHPDWWVAQGLLGDQTARSAPQAMRATT